jgi:probable addiction module antidote protein
MTLETSPWDTAEFLDTPERVAAYLKLIFDEGDPEEIKHALGVVARAKGMTAVARETGLSREALYKALQADGDPKLSTFLSVVSALGMRIVAKPARTKRGRMKRPIEKKAA